MHLILATKNADKVREMKSLIGGFGFEVFSLNDMADISDIEEDGNTFLENASKKAYEVWSLRHEWVIADDSGLVVDALGGAPGVNSARYSGGHGDYVANNIKLMDEMKGLSDAERTARFVCSMVMISPSNERWNVEGVCEGVIIREPRGDGGFGYDPLFYVPQLKKTMAELSMAEKNIISHRGKALRQIRKILENNAEKSVG